MMHGLKDSIEERSRKRAQTPLDPPVETRARRDEEIRQRGIDDAKKSFNTIRELLREGIRQDSR